MTAELGFTADQWIAPGDRVRFLLASGTVEVEVAETGFTVDADGAISDLDVVVRVLHRARGELDDLRAAAPEPDQARLGTAAAGLTLVLGWLTQTSQALADVAGEQCDLTAYCTKPPGHEPPCDEYADAVAEPVNPAGHHRAAEAERAAPAKKAPAVKVAATRPPSMPAPGEDASCEGCGATVPAEDAAFSWARHRKVLCREPDGGCFGKYRPAKAPTTTTPAPAGEETTE